MPRKSKSKQPRSYGKTKGERLLYPRKGTPKKQKRRRYA